MARRGKPKKVKAEAKRPFAGKSPKDEGAKVRDLEKRLAESLEREKATGRALTEALEQQTATSEILGVISSSPRDVQPVFDAIVRSAVRLCHAAFGGLHRVDGEMNTQAAVHNIPDDELAMLRGMFPRPIRRDTLSSRAILDRCVVHIPDIREDAEYNAAVRNPQADRGYRTALAVPMLREGAPIGAIVLWRREVLPFTDKQIEMVQTFADQAVIAIENVRLFRELQEKNHALTEAHSQVTEALEQQTATSELLKVIGRSTFDLKPVFETLTENAIRLCGATQGLIWRFDGQVLRPAVTHNLTPENREFLERNPIAPGRGSAAGRAALERRPVHIHDVQADPEYSYGAGQLLPYRTLLAIPMLRAAELLGVIVIQRDDKVLPFTDTQISLVETFADQAAIAIENVRLFKELEARNRDLAASSEILQVISCSPTDVLPVFDVIAASAARLCESFDANIFRRDGDRLVLAAHHGPIPAGPVDQFTIPLTRGTVSGRAVLDREAVHVADMQTERDEFREGRELARSHDDRTILGVPLLREGTAIGVIILRRTEARPFSERQVALLQTFADQAVIAIENVRLFTELQASNRELTTALDTQTATSDILRVISRSQTDVQPVFDAILASAVHLLGTYSGMLTRVAGDQIVLAALTTTDDAGDASLRALFPTQLHFEGPHAQVIRDRVPFNIADARSDPRLSEASRATYQIRGSRSQVVVPLLRHGEAIGAIAVTRSEPGGFTDDEIALLQTFADQAVIAIENARLFSELQARTQELTRSVDQLTALGEVGRAVSSSLDLDTVLTTIVRRAVQLSGADGGTIFEYDEGTEEFAPRATLDADESQSAMLRATRLRRGEGAVGQMAVTREPIQIPDIAEEGAYESRLRGALIGAGTRALLAIPLLHEERIVGGLVVSRRTPGEFTVEVVEILRTFATQSALAIQNARLFKEIEVKSRELEAASRHKSEFLTNMSHELRTPLNAIIGYSEMLQEEAADLGHEPLVPDLQKINAAAKHLLSLINDILDLSKVEAGRMELESAAFDLPTTIDDTMLLMRERAGRRGIGLERHVEAGVGQIRADERKVKQVLLNLLSNAVKFTPEGGQVSVHAALVDGRAQISVTDTGIGIATEDQEAVFEEFRQVGKADKKAEGTGLGLALCRKFVELHGGRIWVTSQIGAGSTFTFTLPLGQ